MKKIILTLPILLLFTSTVIHAGVKEQQIFKAISQPPITNNAWTWQNLQKLPNIKWQNNKLKYQPNAKYYYLEGSILPKSKNSAAIYVQGTKQIPTKISIETDSTGGHLKPLTIADFVPLNEITEIHTRCTTEDDSSTFSFHLYQWQKQGSEPLFITFNHGISNGIAIESYGIDISKKRVDSCKE